MRNRLSDPTLYFTAKLSRSKNETRHHCCVRSDRSASTAYSQRKYADPIPQPHKFPDPCDNPTVKRWGPMDQKGNFNYITPAKILDALKLVREGRLIRLDHLIEPGRNGVIGRHGY